MASKKDVETFFAIKRLIEKEGWPPSTKEIAAEVRRSVTHVNGSLNRLAEAGVIRRGPGTRMIAITFKKK